MSILGKIELQKYRIFHELQYTDLSTEILKDKTLILMVTA